MFHATPDKSTWAKYKTGVLCFVKDNTKKAYYMRLVDVNVRPLIKMLDSPIQCVILTGQDHTLRAGNLQSVYVQERL